MYLKGHLVNDVSTTTVVLPTSPDDTEHPLSTTKILTEASLPLSYDYKDDISDPSVDINKIITIESIKNYLTETVKEPLFIWCNNTGNINYYEFSENAPSSGHEFNENVDDSSLSVNNFKYAKTSGIVFNEGYQKYLSRDPTYSSVNDANKYQNFASHGANFVTEQAFNGSFIYSPPTFNENYNTALNGTGNYKLLTEQVFKGNYIYSPPTFDENYNSALNGTGNYKLLTEQVFKDNYIYETPTFNEEYYNELPTKAPKLLTEKLLENNYIYSPPTFNEDYNELLQTSSKLLTEQVFKDNYIYSPPTFNAQYYSALNSTGKYKLLTEQVFKGNYLYNPINFSGKYNDYLNDSTKPNYKLLTEQIFKDNFVYSPVSFNEAYNNNLNSITDNSNSYKRLLTEQVFRNNFRCSKIVFNESYQNHKVNANLNQLLTDYALCESYLISKINFGNRMTTENYSQLKPDSSHTIEDTHGDIPIKFHYLDNTTAETQRVNPNKSGLLIGMDNTMYSDDEGKLLTSTVLNNSYINHYNNLFEFHEQNKYKLITESALTEAINRNIKYDEMLIHNSYYGCKMDDATSRPPANDVNVNVDAADRSLLNKYVSQIAVNKSDFIFMPNGDDTYDIHYLYYGNVIEENVEFTLDDAQAISITNVNISDSDEERLMECYYSLKFWIVNISFDITFEGDYDFETQETVKLLEKSLSIRIALPICEAQQMPDNSKGTLNIYGIHDTILISKYITNIEDNKKYPIFWSVMKNFNLVNVGDKWTVNKLVIGDDASLENETVVRKVAENGNVQPWDVKCDYDHNKYLFEVNGNESAITYK